MNMHDIVGTHDILFMTLDTLRYDVAVAAWQAGETPNLASVLPTSGWEQRHTPGSFTFAAHQAFFAGFLPTPAKPGIHPRLFAANFPGASSVTDETYTFDTPDIVTGLAQAGYHTICIGGVGFFNKQSPLAHVLPNLFHESHWSREMGVTGRDAMAVQVRLAAERLASIPASQRVFLFINVPSLHQPNFFYLPGATDDSIETHRAALRYVDSQLPSLFAALRQRAPTFCIVCSDHGTTYGEDGYKGHRIGHPIVYTVPYAHFVLPTLLTLRR